MSANILKIGQGVSVMPVSLALKRNPQLWNQHSGRTDNPLSPHRETDDIWVRYAEGGQDGERVDGPHESVWFPAYRLLPQLRDIVFGVMGLVQGERLGGVLLTKIPPGGKVFPHSDTGWHAEYYDKFAVSIEAHPQQSFNFADGGLITNPGDIFWFHNQSEHWVINDSPVDRITLILCIHTDKYNDLKV